jgi:hypothetical protein
MESVNQRIARETLPRSHYSCVCFSFVARMESIMNKTCFVELMGCTLNMCLLGFYTIMVKI